jgi:hypothetical protein
LGCGLCVRPFCLLVCSQTCVLPILSQFPLYLYHSVLLGCVDFSTQPLLLLLLLLSVVFSMTFCVFSCHFRVFCCIISCFLSHRLVYGLACHPVGAWFAFTSLYFLLTFFRVCMSILFYSDASVLRVICGWIKSVFFIICSIRCRYR